MHPERKDIRDRDLDWPSWGFPDFSTPARSKQSRARRMDELFSIALEEIALEGRDGEFKIEIPDMRFSPAPIYDNHFMSQDALCLKYGPYWKAGCRPAPCTSPQSQSLSGSIFGVACFRRPTSACTFSLIRKPLHLGGLQIFPCDLAWTRKFCACPQAVTECVLMILWLCVALMKTNPPKPRNQGPRRLLRKN